MLWQRLTKSIRIGIYYASNVKNKAVLFKWVGGIDEIISLDNRNNYGLMINVIALHHCKQKKNSTLKSTLIRLSSVV